MVKDYQTQLRELLAEFDIVKGNLLRYSQKKTLSSDVIETLLHFSPSSIDEKLFILKNSNGISKDLSNSIELWRIDFREKWERQYYNYLDLKFRNSSKELIEMANLLENYKKKFEFEIINYKNFDFI